MLCQYLPKVLRFFLSLTLYLLSLQMIRAQERPKIYQSEQVSIPEIGLKEDVFDYVIRVKGQFDHQFYQKVVGAANEFKEGDAAIGLAAADQLSRDHARQLLARTSLEKIHQNPLFIDGLQKLIWSQVDQHSYDQTKHWTLGQLKDFLLSQPQEAIHQIRSGLDSDMIGHVVKLMSNEELTQVGRTVFNPLPESQIGGKGYLSARLQPNSPTDNPDDIAWQVFDGWSYAVGDLMLGTNPVDSTVESVHQVEERLKDIVQSFEKKHQIKNLLPWVVLAHIDVQAEVEKKHPGSTSLWFQSLAGTESANKTYDLTLNKMKEYAKSRKGPFGLYFETGQGADYTNGHDHGFDMVVHESRNYGFSCALKKIMTEAQREHFGESPEHGWVVVNDVAGFIGPEVFKSKEQLLRATLEDIVMGKLHGLTHGLDVCSTLHMSVSLDDLDWVLERVMPANPSYLMALPTKNDPMLSYLTTSFQDHVRLRHQFGYKINDKMAEFFKKIKILDDQGNPTENYGNPLWVYYQFRLSKGDSRSQKEIYLEGQEQMNQVLARGVPLAIGHGDKIWDMSSNLDKQIRLEYADAKSCLRSELSEEFIQNIPDSMVLKTTSCDREDFILHPQTGELLSEETLALLKKLKESRASKGEFPQVQIVISDGLNAQAIMDEGHLSPFLKTLREKLAAEKMVVAKENLVMIRGRVRAGYKIGETLFDQCEREVVPHSPKAIIHIIGERPGTIHHNYSVYIASPSQQVWAQKGQVDHDIVKVVSGISDSALTPELAAEETVQLLKEIIERDKNLLAK